MSSPSCVSRKNDCKPVGAGAHDSPQHAFEASRDVEGAVPYPNRRLKTKMPWFLSGAKVSFEPNSKVRFTAV